ELVRSGFALLPLPRSQRQAGDFTLGPTSTGRRSHVQFDGVCPPKLRSPRGIMTRAAIWGLLISFLPTLAAAAPDGTFGLGTGRDWTWPPSTNPNPPVPPPEPLPTPSASTILNAYTTLLGESNDGVTITVADVTHFGVGDLILLWQGAGNR